MSEKHPECLTPCHSVYRSCAYIAFGRCTAPKKQYDWCRCRFYMKEFEVYEN